MKKLFVSLAVIATAMLFAPQGRSNGECNASTGSGS